MRKYWLIIKNTWDELTTYRLNFIMWRVRVVIRFLITFFFWSSIFSTNQTIRGYDQSSMLTYVFLIFVIGNFVFSTRTQDIGTEINEGKLTIYLLRPIQYFKSIIARDIGDKLMNIGFTIIEIIFFFVVLNPPFYVQSNQFFLVLFLFASIGSITLYFMISILLGLIGFWSTEIWATRYIFFILMDFLAGNLFPIDIFPQSLVTFLKLTPFPYILYFPVKIYLGQLSTNELLFGFGIVFMWSVILFQMISNTWKQGLKVYSAEGR